ncbi:hypothetical protein [Reichenbachiella sp. MSK19-1]|uniref:hypothetical protein n=1 Tax=Reichenbachiella sp. MSK19-1 TaxID=1897631 RepID=UPI000E6B7C96|nr:hypothetical protein [Reichenbachiella sp. MSK19-1]RJE74169.1 hypothetical protein BGP76_13335 [Reichenbachiella sp. MSK19-1]
MLRRLLLATVITTLGTGSLFATTGQKNQNGDDKPKIEKLLVIVLVQTIENRRVLEEELAFEFSDYGVSTVLSHNTRLGGSEHLTAKEVAAVSKRNGADGVLLVKLVDIEKQNAYSYNQQSQYTGAGTPSYNSSGVVINNTGVYAWGDYAYGNYFDTVSSNIMEVQSDLFLATSTDPLFSSDTKMRVGEVEKAIGKFSKKLTKQVIKSKYVKTTK